MTKVIDYGLHEKSKSKIEEIINLKVDVERREKNLKSNIRQLEKDKEAFVKEKQTWADKLNIKLKTAHAKEKVVDDDVKRATDVGEEVDTRFHKIQQKEKELKEREQQLNTSLETTKRKVKTLDNKNKQLTIAKEVVAKTMAKAVEEADKSNILKSEAEELVKNAEKKKEKADTLFKRAKEKNTEANGLKIKLGLRAKGLDVRELALNKIQREQKFRRQELDAAGKELQLKRQLLTKAYTQADVEELDTKIEQMIRTEQEQLLPKNRRKVI